MGKPRRGASDSAFRARSVELVRTSGLANAPVAPPWGLNPEPLRWPTKSAESEPPTTPVERTTRPERFYAPVFSPRPVANAHGSRRSRATPIAPAHVPTNAAPSHRSQSGADRAPWPPGAADTTTGDRTRYSR